MNYIKNKEELSGDSSLRRDSLDILNAGYSAINTESILKEKISLIDDEICIGSDRFTCSNYKNVYFIGIGKCAFEGAEVIEEILGDKIADGVVLDVNAGVLKKMRSFKGTHPLPSEENVSVTKQIVSLLGGVGKEDLVLVLISGGGSALLCLPHNIDCDTLIKVTLELTKAGADIYELNTVRKHLSEIQGGQLAKFAYPAEVISLIFSDVLGDDISFIASGPTVYDNTTIQDAEKVLEKYDILKKCGLKELKLKETPKDEKYFLKVKNMIVASNKDALVAMRDKAERLGYESEILTNELSGEAREVGISFAERSKEEKKCFIAGGETTVKIKGDGKGGRNQEAVLASLPYLPKNRVFISAASDGRDNTDTAGALGDSELYSSSLEKGLDVDEYLKDNNSYEFFKKAGGRVETGITGSNVSDLFLLLDK